MSFISKLRPKSHGSPREDYLATVTDSTQQPQQSQHNSHSNILLHGHHSHHQSISSPISLQPSPSSVPVPSSAIPIPYSHSTSPPPVTSPGHILLSPPQSSFSSLLNRPRLYMSHSSSAVTTTSSGHFGSHHHHNSHHSNLQQSTTASDLPTSSSLQRINNFTSSSSPPVPSHLSSLSTSNNFPENHIFGVPLETSIKYASSNIILKDKAGKEYVYGQIPIIVSKCSYFLKKNAANTEGIFRLSGSARRIKELQAIFSDPPAYGKSLDWVGFNVHDAANVLRRYLNNLPEPIIPLDHYDQFRKPLSQYPVIIEHLQGNQSISATSPGFMSPSTNPSTAVSSVPESNLETVPPLANTASDTTTTEIDKKNSTSINSNNEVNNFKATATASQLLSGSSDIPLMPETVTTCSNNSSTGNISFNESSNSLTGSSSNTSETTPQTEDTVSPTTPTTPLTTSSTKEFRDKLSSGVVTAAPPHQPLSLLLPQPPSSSTQNLSSTSSLLLPSTSTSPSSSLPKTSYSQQPQAQSSTPIISSKPSAFKSNNDNEKLQEETADAIELYKQLLETLPPLNRQLLLYILDLLAFFAKHWQSNLMPAVNLAAIFQPSLLSHPNHSMIPNEYHLSRAVVQFLIEHFYSLVPLDLDPDKAKTSNTTKDPRPRHHYRRHSKSMSSVNIPSQVTSYLESSKATDPGTSSTTSIPGPGTIGSNTAVSPPSSAASPSSHTNSFTASISNLAKRSVSPVQSALTAHIKNRGADNALVSTGNNNISVSASDATTSATSIRSRALSPSRHSNSASSSSSQNPPGSPPSYATMPLTTPAVATTGIFSALKRASSITRRKRAPSTSTNPSNLTSANPNSSTTLGSASSTHTGNSVTRSHPVPTLSSTDQTSQPNSALHNSERILSSNSMLLPDTPLDHSVAPTVTAPINTGEPTSMLIPETEPKHTLHPGSGTVSTPISSQIAESRSSQNFPKTSIRKPTPSSMLLPESLTSPVSAASERPDSGNVCFSSTAMSSSSSLTALASALSYGSTSSAAAIITATSTATVKKASDEEVSFNHNDSCTTFTKPKSVGSDLKSVTTPIDTPASSNSSNICLGKPVDHSCVSDDGSNAVTPESAQTIPEITTSKVDSHDLNSNENVTLKLSKNLTSIARSSNPDPHNTSSNSNFSTVGGFSSGSSSDEAEPVSTISASTLTELDAPSEPPVLQLPQSSNNTSSEVIGTESGRSKFRRHRKRMSQSLSNMSNRLTRRSLSPLAQVDGGNTSGGELSYRNITPNSLSGNNVYGNISSGGSSPLSLAASSSAQSLQQQTDSREQQSLDNAIASMSLSAPPWHRNNSTGSGNCAFSSESSSIDCESDGDYDEPSSIVYSNTTTVAPVAIGASSSVTGITNNTGLNNNLLTSSSDTSSLPTTNKSNVSLWRRSLIAINIPVTASSSSAPASATTTSLSTSDQEADGTKLTGGARLSPRMSPNNDDNTSIMTAPTLGSSPNSRQGWLHRPFKARSRNNSRSQINSDDERAPT